MRTIEAGRAGAERRRHAVAEIQGSLTGLYRGFVAWSSLYGDGGEERERRERVGDLIEDLLRSYLPRSVWLAPGTRDKVEGFANASRDLRDQFRAEVEEKGYERARAGMARRVSKKLGPMRKQADLALETELRGPPPSRWRLRRG